MKIPKQSNWLWWLAFWIAAGAVALIVYFKQDAGMINADQHIKTVILIASVAIGLCIISATSQWWIKR
ncbi:MAG TPA: hypothetical protein PKA21_01980 [Kiritimatiellia bacterium]|nr:hypothetical protein [Kiritimatiellia bacterium]HMP96351.1 hypothetical protein [Kiritimatiellia bacterium]